MIEANAPGKLVICGEYAVLEGAPAIAVAMPVRARACIGPARDESTLTVTGRGCWRFRWEQGLARWREQPPLGLGCLLESVAGTLAAEGCAPSRPLAIELDTLAFQHIGADGRGHKLGLGSSAALSVALMAGLHAEVTGREAAPAGIESLAQRAHRHFQGGAGSGIDIAAAVHGGVVLIGTKPGGTRAVGWPPGLHWLAAWSGESASTPALLTRFEAFRCRDPVAFTRHLTVLDDLAVRLAAAWMHGDAAMVLTGLAAYDAALRALDDAAAIGIITPAHERLARLAADTGAIYKTSGAGGGDFGIAFATSQAVLARFAAACAAEGFFTLAGDAGAEGVAARFS